MTKEQILKAATLSISAHNVQPFRLAFPSDSEIHIYVDFQRLLPVGDPHLKDLRQSLGALIETLAIAMSAEGEGVEIIEAMQAAEQGQPMARLKRTTGVPKDVLGNQLARRFSYRGKFAKKKSIQNHLATTDGFTIEFLTKPADLKDVSQIFDSVNYRFLTLPGYLEELYSWMRFSSSHPKWSKDGLNTESMSLSGVEAWGASVILKKAVFDFLAKLGMAKTLVSEAGQIQSSSALAVILCKSHNDIDKGRAFMRAWLTLTEMNLFGAPLSLLTDDKPALDLVQKKLNTKGQEIVNVLRVGPLADSYKKPAPARLTYQEMEWKK